MKVHYREYLDPKVVRYLREEKRLSLLDMAKKLDVTRSYLSRAETGSRTKSLPELIFSTAEVFNVSKIGLFMLALDPSLLQKGSSVSEQANNIGKIIHDGVTKTQID